MPSNNDTTTKFKVDISELKTAMQQAKRSISVANSEFKAAASACDDWTKSSDGLSAKIKQLDTNLKSQKTILANLEEQYELTVKEMGEGSAAADRLKVAINNQKATINNTEREISKYEDALAEVSEAEKIAAKTGKDVAEVLDDTRKKAEDAGDGFTVLKGAVATFAGNVITSLVGSLKEAASNLLNLAEETREYRTELAKLESGATQAGASADYIKDKWMDMGAVLGDEGAVTEGLNNLLAAGYTTEEEMDAITQSLEGAAIKWKDTLKFEGMADGLQETLATGSAVGQFGELLERSGVNLETFNEGLAACATEADKQNYVLEQLSALGLADVSKAYRDSNSDMIAANKANAEYTDSLAQLGEKIEPVTTTLKQGFNELLQELLALVGDVDIEAFTTKMQEGFKVVTDEVIPAVKEGFGWILDHKDELIAGLAGIAAGFVAFKVVTLIQGVSKAMQGMTLAQYALNLAMSLNPIGLIVAAIAGLVVAFVTLWNKSETFRNFWIGLWEGIKNACSVAKEWIGQKIEEIGKFFTETLPNFFSGVVEWVKANWQSLLLILVNPFAGLFKYFYDNNSKFKEFVDTAVNFIKELPSKIWTWLVNTINNVIEWRKNMINKAKETALSFINKIVEYVKQLPSKIWTWLLNTASKVVSWKSDMVAKAKTAATDFVNEVINYVKELPAKFKEKIDGVLKKIESWGSDMATKGTDAAKDFFNSVVDGIDDLPEKVKGLAGDVVTGLWSGMSDKAAWLKQQISGFVGNVKDWLKDYFGINSPSKLMADEVGRWLPEGIAVGIDENAKSAINSMKNLAVNTMGAAASGLKSGVSVAGVPTGGGGVVNNFTQNNYSPKSLSRLEIYRQSKNLLGYAGGV